jgi:hypothetical protein
VGGTVIDAGIANCTITADIKTVSTGPFGGNGFVFRYQDSSNYWAADGVAASSVAASSGASVRITEVNGGSAVTRATQSGTIALATTYTGVSLALDGPSISFTMNGVNVTYSSSFLQTETEHGFSIALSGAASKVDNWTAGDLPSVTPAVLIGGNLVSGVLVGRSVLVR